eukprot:NODE_3569_length_876_cov_72.260347_g3547_i0.p1 GENE.NODE_3569_length_876_cov_72.260347_g3547_i0~~NODE_3569_length_876_cov_72.260347_g3547_i0.p1  ORF type:complete len:221 (+),score=57.54 NODE_3569_length_876_cov_72.260347_g3547_i0:60-722(+)
MPTFGKIFGKKEKAPTTNESIQNVGDSVAMLDKRAAVLQRRIDEVTAKARDCTKKGDKKGALEQIKRKRTYQGQMDLIDKQRANLEHMQAKLEDASMNAEVLAANQAAARGIQREMGKMNAEKVDEAMDKVRETVENADEITQALAQDLNPNPIDEDDLMDELAELEQLEMDSEMMGLDDKLHVPTGQIGDGRVAQPAQAQPAAQEEDDELAALAAELNA